MPKASVFTALVFLSALAVVSGQDAQPKPLPTEPLEKYDDPPAPSPLWGIGVSPGMHSTFGVFTSHQVNVDSNGQNITGDAANEPSIAVDPTNGNRMVIGWRQFNSVTSNFRQSGFGFTANGGTTWTFPGLLENNVFRSDPVLFADELGRFYYNSLLETFFDDIWRSLNGGQSWTNLNSPGNATGGDKQWHAIDNNPLSTGRGFQYQIWSTAGNNFGGRQFSRSTDGGVTWMNPIFIPNSPIWGTPDVDSNGILYVGGISGSNFRCIRSSNARNGAVTPTFDQNTIVSLGGTLVTSEPINPAGLAGQLFLAVDRSGTATNNNIYMLASVQPTGFSNGTDVMFARSTNGGQTFSAPQRINDDPVNHNKWHWLGTLAVAPNGRIDSVWLDTRNAANNTDSQLFYSFSTDGGISWSANVAVSTSFNPFLGYPNQNKMGDYITIVSDNTGGNVAYAATFNLEEDIYYVRVVPGIAPTPTPSATPTPSVAPTPSIAPTPSATPTPPATPTPSSTPSATPTATIIAEPTATPTPACTPSTIFSENFDGVTAPALPGSWVTSFTNGAANCTPTGTCALGTNWATNATGPHAGINSAFHDAPGCVTDSRLTMPIFAQGLNTGDTLSFWHRYNLINGGDGAVLEISVAGGPFIDIAISGAVILSGGYNGTISAGNLSPIAGRDAWTGNSGGYINTRITLQQQQAGQSIQFRFRLATDCIGASVGWNIDTITVLSSPPCPTPTPPPIPTATPSATPTPPITPTPTPTATATASPTTSVTPTATPVQPAQPLNLSTRLRVQGGENVGIGGFIIAGSGPKTLLLRAIGPSLTGAGVPDALADPVMELRGPKGFVTVINNDWMDDTVQAALILSTGIAPTNNLESAIHATLDPGPYTAIVRGNNDSSGVGLVEIYDLSEAVPAKLANISTRAFVSTGDNIVIAGFILGGGSGIDQIAVRGIGPSLIGVSNPLADPTLELRDSSGALVAANNDWQSGAPPIPPGIAPPSPLESLIVVPLQPGLYTALLSGVNNGVGVGLVEVYDLGAF